MKAPPIQFELLFRMLSAWKSVCLLPLLCLSLALAHAAETTKPAAKASANVKVAKVAKAGAASKAKAKPQRKARPQQIAKRQQPAKGVSRAAAVSAAATQLAVDENNLDAEIAAARRVVNENPADARARERLAHIAVVLVDALLRAEALGDSGKAGELRQKLVANLYDTGWRVQKMAQGNDLMARQATGFLLERGVLLEMDTNKSCAEFLLAAEQLASAGWHAAQCLMKDSPEKAWTQMERAAVRGHAAAQEWMGRRCVGEFDSAQRDYACARSWLAQAASQGRARSQTLFAYLLMTGHGGPVDEHRAARLYRLAAEQGDADAQNNLGEIHEMGRGTAPNPDQALGWYELAAERGLAAAQFNAGRLWAIGVGDKRDPARARALLVQAEGKGIAQATEVLKWLDRQSPPPSATASGKGPAESVGSEKKD